MSDARKGNIWLAPAIFWAVLLPAGLCETAISGQVASAVAAPADDPPDAAPEEWAEFLDWAETQISQTPPPVPLPSNPRLSEPRWPILRLEEMLADASITCVWQPTLSSGEALTTLGPFRSDSPRSGLRVRPYKHKTFGECLQLKMSGFRAQREDIGSIAIDVRVPFGKHFDLVWSYGGRIRIPLPDNQNVWPFNVATDGLADWSGPFDQIELRTDGIGEGVVEIRSLRFLPRQEAFPEPVGVRRVELDREIRNAVYTHCPATVKFPGITLPPHARLQVGLGQITQEEGRRLSAKADRDLSARAPNDVTEFEIIIEHDDHCTRALNRPLGPGEGWTDVSVELEAWGGQTVSVILRTVSKTFGSLALWGNPTIYEPVKDPPRMVLYLIDTLAAKHANLHGYDRPTMLHISELAANGVWFGRTFSNSPVTAASVPDTQLSMPTERHGVYAPSIAAPLELVSLADALRAAGFATALFSTNAYVGPRQNTDQGFDHFIDRVSFARQREADRTVPLDEVRHWLETHLDRPMFVYIHTAEPHAPYAPPPGFAGRFDPDYTGSINGTLSRSGFHFAKSERDIAHVRALYDEEILYADARFGMFLDLLSELRLRDRVNIFVIADHGEELQEHGHWGHGPSLHTEVMHVPWIAAGPLVTARGRVDTPVQLYDVMPTILALFGVPQPYELSGQSLAPFLQDDTPLDRGAFEQRTIFHSHHRFAGLGIVQYAVIEAGRWKLMYTCDEEPAEPSAKRTSFALYDLDDFFYDKQDVIDQHRDVARRLIEKLITYCRQQHPFDPRLRPTELKLDAEQIRQLQSLGYVESDEEEEGEEKEDRP